VPPNAPARVSRLNPVQHAPRLAAFPAARAQILRRARPRARARARRRNGARRGRKEERAGGRRRREAGRAERVQH
jgi:hypothetical protein